MTKHIEHQLPSNRDLLQDLDKIKEEELDIFTPKQKRNALIACLVSICIGNMMNQNILSFLPIFIKYNEWNNQEDFKLSENKVSLILAIFSVSQIISSPFYMTVKNKLGSKNTIVLGFLMVTFTTLGLGIIANIGNT